MRSNRMCEDDEQSLDTNGSERVEADEQHQIEQVGRALRAMMPWIGNSSKQTAVSSKQKTEVGGEKADGRWQKGKGQRAVARSRT